MTTTATEQGTTFEVGKEYRITGRRTYHEFDIGSIVRCVALNDDSDMWMVGRAGRAMRAVGEGGSCWYVRPDEAEPVETVYTVEDIEGLAALPVGIQLLDIDGDTFRKDGEDVYNGIRPHYYTGFTQKQMRDLTPCQILNPELLDATHAFKVGDCVEVVGYPHGPWNGVGTVVRDDGRLVSVAFDRENLRQGAFGSMYVRKHVEPVIEDESLAEWERELLEASPEPKPTYEVGSRVRVLEDDAYGADGVRVGDLGTVTDFSRNGDLMVKMDDPRGACEGDGFHWYFRPGVDVELVQPEAEATPVEPERVFVLDQEGLDSLGVGSVVRIMRSRVHNYDLRFLTEKGWINGEGEPAPFTGFVPLSIWGAEVLYAA